MKSRAVRLSLFLLFVVALGVSAYLFWMGESRSRAELAASRDYHERALSAARGILVLGAAQQGYVAAGQGDQFWASRVEAHLVDIRATLQGLRADSTAPEAMTSLDNAAAVLEDFEQMDRRARTYAGGGQKLLASDVIFADGIELTAAGTGAVDRARVAEQHVRDEGLNAIRGRQLFAVGTGGGAALLVMLLLLPQPRSAPDEAASIARRTGQPTGDRSFDAGLDISDGWARPPAMPPAAAEPEPPAAPAAAPERAPLPVDIASVALLCTDLAKLADTRSLDALLARAAAPLEASGIVLWIADPDGRELSPIVTHGYTPHLVTRLGIIPRDAENATAAAFRTGLLQTVRTDAISSGAIAAPLLTPAGCVGVMAAEVLNEGEQNDAKLAAATIVAAQLATLVGPPSSRTKAEATG